ncbi:gag poly [Trichoderma arundinaceum]|uniref:Gag poly n=1 Tax=Trichoderma arundinaceum TaxID=490622 RepID=A0A395NAN9_TRIAR|nr:gag poly [Trichoderma arundinaceum]
MPGSSSSIDTPTTEPGAFTVDDEGNILMEDAPDWNSMTQEQSVKLAQNMFRLNKAIIDKLNKKKPTMDIGVLIKRPPPPMYNGNVKELRSHIIQLKAYFKDYENTFDTEEKKVRLAASRLEGTALKWFRPILKDYLEAPAGTAEEKTQTIFGNFGRYIEELERAFGDVGETRMAENILVGMYQKGKCSDYAVRFRDIATRLDWGQSALVKRFYDGLKREVKEKVYDIDRSKHDLISFMEKCVQADNLLYELRMNNKNIEKKESYQPNQGKKRQEEIANDNSGRPGKMDLDSMDRRKKDFKCFNCGKPNHMARNCRSPKKQQNNKEGQKQVNTMDKEETPSKTIHLLDRSPPAHNELEDDSDWSDENTRQAIEDRRPFDYGNARTQELHHFMDRQDIEESHRYYGIRRSTYYVDKENYGTMIPEIRELDEFHHEALDPDHIEDSQRFRNWLHTHQNPEGNRRIIPAVTTDIAIRNIENYERKKPITMYFLYETYTDPLKTQEESQNMEIGRSRQDTELSKLW